MKKDPNCGINCVFQAIDGRGAIYISDYGSASIKEMRAKFNIKAVISIATSGFLESRDELIDYLYIPAQDTTAYDISKHFQETFNFIDKHRRHGNVLVHCMVGKSRSATVVAAYLLKKYRYPLSDVMNLLTRRRKIIDPNPGFIQQLQKFCMQIGVQVGSQNWKSRSLSKTHRRQKQDLQPRYSVHKNGSNVSDATASTQNEVKSIKCDINEKILKIKQKLLKGEEKNIKGKNNLMYSDIKMFQAFSKSEDITDNHNNTNINWKSYNSACIE